MHGSIANIICQLRMFDHAHLLLAAACLPKFFLGKTLDLPGLEFLQALEHFLITDAMRLRVQILKERRYKLGPIREIELRCLLE